MASLYHQEIDSHQERDSNLKPFADRYSLGKYKFLLNQKIRENLKKENVALGKDNLIFCCLGPTNPIFWQIKIVTAIMMSHINILLICFFFFNLLTLITIKYIKNKNLVHLTLLK